ncbi:MAG TPA: tetratricopeptide repeat protein [Bacteroidota bacterium]|nr:tetratricopeptide repeat protein [Bacteroidota bacterium]
MSSRLESLLEFLKHEPNDPFTHYAIALEYASAKDYKTAAAKLEELLVLDPDYVAAYQQLGSVYVQLDRDSDAVRILEQGMEAAQRAGDTHAVREMQDAIDDLED